jgi:hypothetical protein
MNAKVKLNSSSTHIFESDDDKHIVFNHIDKREDCKHDTPKNKMTYSFEDVPVQTGK